MPEDTKEMPDQKTLVSYQLVDNGTAERYKRLAPSFGVGIQILAEEGQEYTHQSGDGSRGTIRIDKGIVPRGKSYMSVSREPNSNINNFLDAIRAEQKAQQPPANPPKI